MTFTHAPQNPRLTSFSNMQRQDCSHGYGYWAPIQPQGTPTVPGKFNCPRRVPWHNIYTVYVKPEPEHVSGYTEARLGAGQQLYYTAYVY